MSRVATIRHRKSSFAKCEIRRRSGDWNRASVRSEFGKVAVSTESEASVQALSVVRGLQDGSRDASTTSVVKCHPGQCRTNTSAPALSSRANRIQPSNPAEKQLTTCRWFIVQITHKELHGASVFKQHWDGTLVEHRYSRIGRLPVRSKHASEVRQSFKACDTPNCKVSRTIELRGELTLAPSPCPVRIPWLLDHAHAIDFRGPRAANRVRPTTQKVTEHP